MKNNPTLIENLVNTDKNSCKQELTISFKAESVEFIFSSSVSQDNSFFFSIARLRWPTSVTAKEKSFRQKKNSRSKK